MPDFDEQPQQRIRQDVVLPQDAAQAGEMRHPSVVLPQTPAQAGQVGPRPGVGFADALKDVLPLLISALVGGVKGPRAGGGFARGVLESQDVQRDFAQRQQGIALQQARETRLTEQDRVGREQGQQRRVESRRTAMATRISDANSLLENITDSPTWLAERDLQAKLFAKDFDVPPETFLEAILYPQKRFDSKDLDTRIQQLKEINNNPLINVLAADQQDIIITDRVTGLPSTIGELVKIVGYPEGVAGQSVTTYGDIDPCFKSSILNNIQIGTGPQILSALSLCSKKKEPTPEQQRIINNALAEGLGNDIKMSVFAGEGEADHDTFKGLASDLGVNYRHLHDVAKNDYGKAISEQIGRITQIYPDIFFLDIQAEVQRAAKAWVANPSATLLLASDVSSLANENGVDPDAAIAAARKAGNIVIDDD